MAAITGAGSIVDIKLGQVPQTRIPALHNELQLVYNSLHILSQYMQVLRADLEGDDSQTPAENVRFQKFLFGTAKQVIAEGAIVSFDTDGQIIKGTSFGALSQKTFVDGNGVPRPYISGMVQTFFGIALNAASIGEEVKVGVGPAILQVTGAVAGQQVYAFASKGQTYSVKHNTMTVYGTVLQGDGNIYLNNPEIQRLPGYPQDVSDTLRILGHSLSSPVGVAVADGYVLFSDFMFWEGRVATNIAQLYP